MPDPRPTELPHRPLVTAIEQLARAQREFGAQLARETGLHRAALSVVRILQRHGEMPIGEIACHLRVDLSVASRHVTALVNDGLAERTTPCTPGLDRRLRTVRLTPAGLATATASAQAIDRRAAEAFADWTPDELASAAAQIRRLTAAVTTVHDEDARAPHPTPIPQHRTENPHR
ncbi:MarR family transcriptional regulator [Cellulomonas cellasea]|uniref:MarR family winged helix-turn-helix transcriptional regulator n=1 Tax=Cellulomonas cellasea TaxID=43670 RepID=UPI0025A40F14|nr:MarR family transcriptional regulator [Cellulomonas cellasea]MDM8084846.1 MarR family transcriptional regulator [Cellulomonas cellasea]